MTLEDIMDMRIVFGDGDKPGPEKGVSYNITASELKDEIEKNPALVFEVLEMLRDFKERWPEEFGKWWKELQIDPAIKDKAGNEVNEVLGHKFEDQVVRALEIVVKYNIPPRIFRFEESIYRVMPIDIDKTMIRKRTVTEGERDIREILEDSGWRRAPRRVVLAVLNGVYGIPKLKGITSKPIVREDGSICNEPGFDRTSRWYYQPGVEDTVSRFFKRWIQKFGNNWIYGRDVVEWIDSDPELKERLPVAIWEAMEKENPVIAVGTALKKIQKVEHNGLQLIADRDTHAKVNRFRVAVVCG